MTSFAQVSAGQNANISLNWTADIARYAVRFLTWSDRARQRRRLKNLDARLLDDIGLTHSQAAAEAGKPRWVA